MKQSDIQVNSIYIGRRGKKVLRMVLRIEKDPVELPYWYSPSPRPLEPVVHYKDSHGKTELLYLPSFAAWCGQRVAGVTPYEFHVEASGPEFNTAMLEPFRKDYEKP